MLIHQDPHCNLFWTYNGNNKDENNITKALINTFESMPNESVFKSLLGLLKIDGYDDNKESKSSDGKYVKNIWTNIVNNYPKEKKNSFALPTFVFINKIIYRKDTYYGEIKGISVKHRHG